MKFSRSNSYLFVVFLMLGACAHHRDVRPSEDGIHRVILMNQEKDFNSTSAMSEAQDYCESLKKDAVVVSETNTYVGTMQENSYNNSVKGAKVAGAIGSTAYMLGGKKESNLGGIVGLGGAVAQGALGNGYKFEMRFKCR